MALAIAICATVAAWIYTFCHVPEINAVGTAPENHSKMREYLTLDIRATSQYCYWYIALIGVSSTIVLGSNRALYAPILNWAHLWPFAVAAFFGSVALIFIPAGYGPSRFNRLRVIWFRSVLSQQVVVISTCYGLWKNLSTLVTGVP